MRYLLKHLPANEKKRDQVFPLSAKADNQRRSRQTAANSFAVRNIAVSLLLILAGVPALLTPTACFAQAANAPAPVTPEQKAAALAGAKELITKMGQVNSLPGFADILTNKSAGAMGLFFTAIAGMAVGFADMPGAKSDSGLPPAQIKSDYDALMAKYGLTKEKTDSDDATLPPAILKNGRQFLVDIGTFMDKMGKKGASSFHGSDAPKVDEITYTVLSPTHVKLTPKPIPGKKTQPPLDAVVEDGQWRLDLGDIKKLFTNTANSPSPTDDPALHNAPSRYPKGTLTTDNSPLAASFFDALAEAANSGKVGAVQAMLKQHPDLVKARDVIGQTPLFQAVFGDDLPTTRLLLAAGADVNAHADSGKTPLDDALFFHKDNKALLALLRQHGAKPSAGKR